MYKSLAPLIFIVYAFFVPSISYAQDPQFQISKTLSYYVYPNYTITIEESATITNLTSQAFPQQYVHTIIHPQVANIVAHDSQGQPLEVIHQLEHQPKQILVVLPPNLGKSKVTQLTLRYDLPGIAESSSRIGEFNLPIVQDANSLISELKLYYDTSLPSIASIHPTASGQTTKDRWIVYQLNTQPIPTAIKTTLGKSQVYAFTITYPFAEDSKTDQGYRIAIPPDTAYQRVAITQMQPRPNQVQADPDGNWIATFAPGLLSSSLEITGLVEVFNLPHMQNPPTADTKPWLTTQPYWETTNPALQNLAGQLNSPFSLYDYTIKHLTYDYAKPGHAKSRLGANSAFERASGNSLEFTDLFITLSRAANIPARRVVGYAHSDNPQQKPLSEVTDILHTWAEYYDSATRQWTPVDPTWQHTTGLDYFNTWDFNHIVFAYNGLSSQHPWPPVVTDSEQNKNISISLSPSFPEISQQLDVKITSSWFYIPFQSQSAQYTLYNHASTAQHQLTVVPEGRAQYRLIAADSANFLVIPPFGHAQDSFQYKSRRIFPPSQFIIDINGQDYAVNVPDTILLRQYIVLFSILFIYGLLTFAVIRLTRQAWGVPIQRSHRAHPVRGQGHQS